MHSDDWMLPFEDIIKHARAARRPTTNLYLDTVPYQKGRVIGPGFQDIRAQRRCWLVFADDDPMANFGHPCRYLLYDEKTHAFLDEVAAHFPPYLHRVPDTFKVVDERVRAIRSTLRTPLVIDPTPAPAPAPAPPARERYAILFSGSSDRRHLNDLEYCYRMLTKRYEFKPANICVLNFDNTRKVKNGLAGATVFANNWPTETSPADPFQIPIPPPPPPAPQFPPLPQPLLSAKADRVGFRLACQKIAAKLQPQDLVFIHTNGHGDATRSTGQPQNPRLVQHDSGPYFATDFCLDLAMLPTHESLLIVMQQCFSGLFIDPVISAKGPASNQIKASRLSIACASPASSYSTEDFNFDKFTLGWVTAHLDKDPYGFPPKQTVDTGDGAGGGPPNGLIEACEAHVYAKAVKHSQDNPSVEDAPAVISVSLGITTLAAGDIRLDVS